jgi:urease accessory protein
MGAPAIRITAADFVTPPELGELRLAATVSGRIGGARLELVDSRAGTRLGSCYQQIPLRVLPPFCFGSQQPALLYLLNPTAGLMDGDGHLVEITARAGTRALVAGQSATRIHPSLAGYATQQWLVRVEAGAVLVVLPGPAIPFRGCRYYQRATIELAAGASLVWGDVWLAGRYARGEDSEHCQFTTLIQDLTVRREGRLVYRDRFCWRGPWDRRTATWHFGANPACGSLFVSGPVNESWLPSRTAPEAALFPTAEGDACVRWCGSSEGVIASLVETALRAGSALAGGPAPWLLETHDIAPNHWFVVRALGREETVTG